MKFFLLILLVFLAQVSSYKILVYNALFGHSHSNFLGNIADILVESGHDVTTFMPVIDPSVKDGTSKSKKIFIPQSNETKQILVELNSLRSSYFLINNLDPFTFFSRRTPFVRHFVSQCHAVLENTEILKQFQEEKFDVMIVENFDMCAVAYSHLVKPRSLITTSASIAFAWMIEEFGIPLALSYNPSSYTSHLDVHSMWSRLNNIYVNWVVHTYFYPRRSLIDDLYRDKFGADFPSLMKISSNAAYTFINSEPLIDYATPTLNRVIGIGGIGAKEPKPLDEKWNEILSRRSETVLISFGSIAKSAYIPPHMKESIKTVISRFPNVTFIWKYEKPEDDFGAAASSSLSNLVLTPWMPQNDLLNDERIKVFITHGGMASTQETALRGKAGIFIPLFGDQGRNAGMMEYNGFGKVLDKLDLAYPDVLGAAVREVLTNEKYHENARRVSAMLAKKPFKARELMIKTVEFAAEFGPSSALRSQSYDMNAVEYHNLDIIAVSLLILCVFVFTTKKIVCGILRKLTYWSVGKLKSE